MSDNAKGGPGQGEQAQGPNTSEPPWGSGQWAGTPEPARYGSAEGYAAGAAADRGPIPAWPPGTEHNTWGQAGGAAASQGSRVAGSGEAQWGQGNGGQEPGRAGYPQGAHQPGWQGQAQSQPHPAWAAADYPHGTQQGGYPNPYPPPSGYGFDRAPWPPAADDPYRGHAGYGPPYPAAAPGYAAHNGSGAGVGQGTGPYATAGFAALMDEMLGEGNGLSSLSRMLNLDDKELWKGALVGAAAVLLLTNESVQNALMHGGARARDAVRTGVDKLKPSTKGAGEGSA